MDSKLVLSSGGFELTECLQQGSGCRHLIVSNLPKLLGGAGAALLDVRDTGAVAVGRLRELRLSQAGGSAERCQLVAKGAAELDNGCRFTPHVAVLSEGATSVSLPRWPTAG